MKVLVTGAGGFIGGHLVNRLINDGKSVVAVDIKPLASWYQVNKNAQNLIHDLSQLNSCQEVTSSVDYVYNLAADMGGMGFIEKNKALCMLSSLINTHLLLASKDNNVKRYFFSSSACVYASWHQKNFSQNPLKETDAYPADPEDGYGWEKLFSERMCKHFEEDFGISVRIARFHNIYGPYGTYSGGREKAPAAACRKVIECVESSFSKPIKIWGDGKQIRSFTYISDCIDGICKIMESDFADPLNLGSSEITSIENLYRKVIEISAANTELIDFEYELEAPKGVNGRSSDNALIKKVLGWEPSISLESGLRSTFEWIKTDMKNKQL
jgi:GDP-D-mannose 3',5'-epimerase